MQFVEAGTGRIFILRLEQGEIIHTVIEDFASRHKIERAVLTAIGGVDRESRLVTGPEDGLARPVKPMLHSLDDVHEVVGAGTIFPDEKGDPVLHMHMACGRKNTTVTGCIRPGVAVWQILEVYLQELTGAGGVRRLDQELGLGVLECS